MNKNLGKLGASEKQILDQTFKAISDSIITAKKSEVTLLESLDKKNPNDFIAEVKIDSVRLKYIVEIKGKITKADKVMLSMPGNDYRLPRIILTSYVNPEMAHPFPPPAQQDNRQVTVPAKIPPQLSLISHRLTEFIGNRLPCDVHQRG